MSTTTPDTMLDEEPDDLEEPEMGPPSETPNLKELLEERDAVEDEIIQAMVDWFFTNFEDPVHETPWDEGEYVYIWGGPYYAHEELWDAFDEMPESLVKKAIERIENEGFEWAPSNSRMLLR
jgi:hypothetical protein